MSERTDDAGDLEPVRLDDGEPARPGLSATWRFTQWSALALVVVLVALIAGGVVRHAAEPASWQLCPSALQVKSFGPDGLPPLAEGATDRAQVGAVLKAHEISLRDLYPFVASFTVGPGFGRAWIEASNGTVMVRRVRDYAIIAVVDKPQDCPSPQGFAFGAIGEIPIFFAAK